MVILPKPVYSVKETCYEIGVGRTTLYWLRKQGLIRPIPGPGPIRFSRQEILRYLGIDEKEVA
jgi:predicted site-specific integrase-resolvase